MDALPAAFVIRTFGHSSLIRHSHFGYSGFHMTDPRINKLADVLIGYACAVKPGEKILIEAIDVPYAFTNALVRTARLSVQPVTPEEWKEVCRMGGLDPKTVAAGKP